MKYLIEGLPPELQKKAETDLGETEEVKAATLKELRSLIKDEPDLNACMEDAFLLRFLRAKKYRVERAFTTLKNFYAYKATYSGLFTDFKPSDIRQVLEMNQITPCEYRDSTYTGIGIIRLGYVDFHKISPDEMMSCIMVMAEFGVNMESIQVSGYSIIIDFDNITLHTIKKFASPTLIYRIITAIQDVVPCRIKAYHVINQPYYFNIILTLIKTFMSEKLSDRLHVHGSNLKSLYKYVPEDILPEELGGKQGPISKYLQEYKKKLYSLEDHCIKLNKFGYVGKTLKELQRDNPYAIVT